MKEKHLDQAFDRVVSPLHGGPEAPSCEAVKVKPGLCWRPQAVGSARVIGYLPRRAEDMAWDQPKREVLQSMKLKGLGNLKSPLTSDTEMQNLVFVLLGFSPEIFPHYASVLSF